MSLNAEDFFLKKETHTRTPTHIILLHDYIYPKLALPLYARLIYTPTYFISKRKSKIVSTQPVRLLGVPNTHPAYGSALELVIAGTDIYTRLRRPTSPIHCSIHRNLRSRRTYRYMFAVLRAQPLRPCIGALQKTTLVCSVQYPAGAWPTRLGI
jgi:hypothetical protein